MSALPEPLTPVDCDLRDFPFMPLEIGRLRRSKAWLHAKRRPEIGFYSLNLWAASWHDKPAGSLEDDDDVLADLAMCDPNRWDELRAEVLRGWVKCSDGRLYHPVVCEKAKAAWKAKLDQRARTEKARLARAANRQTKPERTTGSDGGADSTVGGDKERPTGSVIPIRAAATVSVTDNVGHDVSASTASKGEGEGESKKERKNGSYASDAPAAADTSAGGGSAPFGLVGIEVPPTPPKPARNARDVLWQDGVPLLREITGKSDGQVRALLGRLLRDLQDDCPRLMHILRDAESLRPADPVAWLQAAAVRDRREPAQKPSRIQWFLDEMREAGGIPGMDAEPEFAGTTIDAEAVH